MHKVIPWGRDPTTEFKASVVRTKDSLLKPILPEDFRMNSPPERIDFDTPVQNLGDYISGTSSKRSTANPAFCRWQSIEDPDSFGHCVPYNCHLIPQGWKLWASNPNNVLVASWQFHQDLTGKIPTLKVEFVADAKDEVDPEDGPRFKAYVRVRFRSKELEESLKRSIRWKAGSTFEGDTVRTCVHVKDMVDFKTCVDIRKSLTENVWLKYPGSCK